MGARVVAVSSCPVCLSTDVEEIGSYRGSHPVFAGMARARCCSCGMVFGAPMPGEDALGEYNRSYFESAHGGRASDRSATAFFSGIARLRLAHVERYLARHNVEVSRVLEVGPGPGYFARSWLAKRPDTTYLGLETDTSCHAALATAGVQVVDVSTFAEDVEVVDLIVMSHVLEHVTDPVRFVGDATRSLRAGGALFIEVPCRDWEHKPSDEPHLLFFDKGPMGRLLTGIGLGNIELSYHGQEITRLRSPSALLARWTNLRSRLIGLGLVAPFARARAGMETLTDPMERAAVAPFKPHRESSEPAWWLRAMALKK